MKKLFLFLLIVSIIITPVMADNQSIDKVTINKNSTYRVMVDNIYGFYRVYKDNNVTSIEHGNRSLNISIGDTIIWENDAVPDTALTITSKPVLWKNITCGQYLCSYLRWDYKQFSYTFNKSGIYDIYIAEYTNFRQKIIVGPIADIIVNKTVNKTNVTITKSNPINNTNKKINSSTNITNTTKSNPINSNKKINSSTNITNTTKSNTKKSADIPFEKKHSEAIVLVTLTSLLIYVFDRKIK